MSGERILIVEDEADVSRYLAVALQDEGYEVVTAANAREGLRIIRDRRPDLVSLDLVMPGRTGISLYMEIHELPEMRDVPVMVVSGVSSADAEENLGLGTSLPAPDAFIEKPIDLPLYLAEVRRLLERRPTCRKSPTRTG